MPIKILSFALRFWSQKVVNFSYVIRNFDTHRKSSSIRLSIEHAAAILTPSAVSTTARSMPRSSSFIISRKSPTLCVTGRSVNWHFSLRLGSGTVTCGSPLIYLTVTSENKQKMVNMYYFWKKNLFSRETKLNFHQFF